MLAWAVVWQPPAVVDLQQHSTRPCGCLKWNSLRWPPRKRRSSHVVHCLRTLQYFERNGKNLWRLWVLSSVGRRQPRTGSNRPASLAPVTKVAERSLRVQENVKVQVFPVAAGQVTLIGANKAVFARQTVVLHIAFASFVLTMRVVDTRVSLLMTVWPVTAGVATSDTPSQPMRQHPRRCRGISFAASVKILSS